MTGRINLNPEAEQQLNEIDDWIAKTATADITRRFARGRVARPRRGSCPDQ